MTKSEAATPMHEPPSLLSKDQIIEAGLYVGAGALVVVPGAFSTGFGVIGAAIVIFALTGLLLMLILTVNLARRWLWKRRHPSVG